MEKIEEDGCGPVDLLRQIDVFSFILLDIHLLYLYAFSEVYNNIMFDALLFSSDGYDEPGRYGHVPNI